MTRIADFVHETQRQTGKESIKRVILDHYGFASHSQSFTKQNHWIQCMMEHVYKHHSIKGRIVIRYDLAIELVYWNMDAISNQDIDSTQCDVRAILRNAPAEQAIAATDVQDS